MVKSTVRWENIWTNLNDDNLADQCEYFYSFQIWFK